MEYLESRPLSLPEVLDAARPASAGEATVLPSFKRGAALLRASDGRLLRLSWDEPASERRRALAAGRYELLGYRLVTESDGSTWHISGSGLRSVTLEFMHGGTHMLVIDPSLRLEERLQSDGVQVALLGHERAGVSLYKDYKRVPLRYRRLDEAGVSLAEGKLDYG